MIFFLKFKQMISSGLGLIYLSHTAKPTPPRFRYERFLATVGNNFFFARSVGGLVCVTDVSYISAYINIFCIISFEIKIITFTIMIGNITIAITITIIIIIIINIVITIIITIIIIIIVAASIIIIIIRTCIGVKPSITTKMHCKAMCDYVDMSFPFFLL